MPAAASRRLVWLLVVVILVLLASNLYFLIVSSKMALENAPLRIAEQHRPRAEADIRGVLIAQQDAWNEGDLDGFMAGYWDSEELRFASGDTVTSGFKATRERYFKRYKADGKEMGTLTFSDETVEVVTSDFALVRGRWRLKSEKNTDEPHGLYTLTLKRFADGWKITTDHTSAAETK